MGTGTDDRQHRGIADRIRAVVSPATHRFSGLGLPSRSSIRGTVQFPLRDRTHSRISPHGGRHRGFLVSAPPGEALTGVAAYFVIAVSVYAQRSTGYRAGHHL